MPSAKSMAAKFLITLNALPSLKARREIVAGLLDIGDVHAGATYPQRLLLVADWGMSSNRC